MELKLLSTANSDDIKAWREAFYRLPPDRQDVYFRPEFLSANQAEGRGAAQCFVAQQGEALLLYPFLSSPIPGAKWMGVESPVFDIQTPYGYGGPVVNEAGEDGGFLSAAWGTFSDWAAKTGVVAEFCRFHPLLRNDRWAGASMKIFPNRPTVFVDLETYPSEFVSRSFFRNHRQTINKAVRAGCQSESMDAKDSLEWFASRYDKTQDQLGAVAETRFGPAYFRSLAEGLQAQAKVRVVRQGEKLVVATLLLEHGIYAHAHLLAYGEASAPHGAVNALFHDAALDAAARGLEILHLGGGRTSEEADSLLSFKARLSPNRAEFKIGTRCHQPELFEQMKKAWENRRGPAPKGYFLFYRVEPDSARER